MDDFNLITHSNSNFDGDKENGVPTLGYLMSLGSTTIAWEVTQTISSNILNNKRKICGSCQSDKENCVDEENTWRLTGETSELNSFTCWQYLCNQVGQEPQISWSKQALNTKYHLIQYHVKAKTIHLRRYSTTEKIVDIFIKALGRKKFEKFKMMLGLTNTPLD